MAHVRRRGQYRSPARAAPLQQLEDDASTATSKRRNMALLRYGRSSRQQNMSETRAHARQIAQTLSKDTTSPTSPNADFFADFGSAFGNTTEKPMDSFADFGSMEAEQQKGTRETIGTPQRSRNRRAGDTIHSQSTPSPMRSRRMRSQLQNVPQDRPITTAQTGFADFATDWPTEDDTPSRPSTGSSRGKLSAKLESSRRPSSGASRTTTASIASSTSGADNAVLRRKIRSYKAEKVQKSGGQPTYTMTKQAGSPKSQRRLANHVANYTKTSQQPPAVTKQQPYRAPSVSSNTTTRSMSSCSTQSEQQLPQHGEAERGPSASQGFTFDAFGLDESEFTKVLDITDDIGEFAMWDDENTSQSPTVTSRSSTPLEGSQDSLKVSPVISSHRKVAPIQTVESPMQPSRVARSPIHARPTAVRPQHTPSRQDVSFVEDPETDSDNSQLDDVSDVLLDRFSKNGVLPSTSSETIDGNRLNAAIRSGHSSETEKDPIAQTDSGSRSDVLHSDSGVDSVVGVAEGKPGAPQSFRRPNIPRVMNENRRRSDPRPKIGERSIPPEETNLHPDVAMESEEKKEEERSPNPGVGNLRARFEKKETAVTVPSKPFSRTHPLPQVEIKSLEAKLGEELLSPERIEEKKFEERKVLAPRFASPISPRQDRAQSEGGPLFRQNHVSQVMKNLERRQSGEKMAEEEPSASKSDVGVATKKSPFGITLRKTGFSPDTRQDPSPAGRPQHESEQVIQRAEAEQAPQRKMSYREKRELELERERQANEANAAEVKPTTDVRDLIRKRIAANKKHISSAGSRNSIESEASSLRKTSSHERAASPKPLSPARRRQSDLIIEEHEGESYSVSEAPAQPSAAVSHMLMLQQLQQRQPPVSPVHATSSRPKPASQPDESPARSRGGLSIDTETDRQSKSSAGKATTPKATMMMLNAFLAGRGAVASGGKGSKDGSDADVIDFDQGNSPTAAETRGTPAAIKDDPTYERYFKMLKVGMPKEVVKHAMQRDGLDPSVMDGDVSKPAGGVPLKEDPTYQKYFKMLKIGMPMEAVKHAMQRDGLDSAVMDQDHSLPVSKATQAPDKAPKEKDSHRRARLHWNTVRKVTSNSLWAQIDADEGLENLEIDEAEFQELFQEEKTETAAPRAATVSMDRRGASVRVIDAKRANNGGIILARLKMSHDGMADAVDRINENALSAEQIENIIEYLPSKEERKALETYMLEGGQDAGQKFESLCECEKFMVSMMTVKHAKQKVRALLFRLQFETCIRDIQQDTLGVEAACDELMDSGKLKKLLGYILKFGNRLNTAGNGKRKAGAFTLDSLLKLNQAKAFDKKTTFLQYIVQIVLRNDLGVAHFKEELPGVFKAERVYWDQCLTDLEELESQLENVRRIALYQARQAQQLYRIRKKKNQDTENEALSDDDISLTLEEEVEALRSTPIGLFTLSAIKYVSAMRDKVEETRAKFTALLEYFGEDNDKMQPHEVFHIIVAFSRDFDKAKERVLAIEKKKQRDKKAASEKPRKGKPPVHSSPAPKDRRVRASDHQPSMGSILNELKARPKISQTPVRKPHHHRQQSHGDSQPPSPSASGYQPYCTPDRPNGNPTIPPSSLRAHERPTPTRNDSSVSPRHKASSHLDVNTADIGAEAPSVQAARNPTTPRSMAAARAKARLRRQRAGPPPSASARLPDDASTDSPLSPRASTRSAEVAGVSNVRNGRYGY